MNVLSRLKFEYASGEEEEERFFFAGNVGRRFGFRRLTEVLFFAWRRSGGSFFLFLGKVLNEKFRSSGLDYIYIRLEIETLNKDSLRNVRFQFFN